MLELTLISAVSTGLLFGLHDVCIRLAGLRGVSSGVLLSLIAGYPVILVLALLLGGFELVSFKALIFYTLAGIINFPLGRSSMYVAIESLGASVASLLVSTSIVYNMIIGLLMGEELSYSKITGSLLILTSIALIASDRGKEFYDIRGLMAGLVAGLSIAISIALGRLGNLESGNPIAGVLIAYTSGLLTEMILTLRGNNHPWALPRSQLAYVTLAGLLAALGQAARYVALMGIGVNVVTPLQNTRPVVATVISSLLSKHTGEYFDVRKLAASITALIGSILLVA